MPVAGSTRRRPSGCPRSRRAPCRGVRRGLVPPAEPGPHQHAARADGLARGQVVPASPTTNERARSRSRSAAARRSSPGCGLRQSQAARIARPRPRDSAGSSRSASIVAPPASSRSAMCWCASSTNDSRDDAAGDAGLVGDDDDREAGAVEHAHGVDAEGEEHQPLEAIEVAGLFDEGPVAIQEHGAASCAVARACRGGAAIDGLEHGVDFNSFHAPVVDRTLAQHAGPAEHVARDDVRVARRRGRPLVGRPEDRRQRHAERRRDVHRARVVRHERGAPRDDPDELPQRRAADQVRPRARPAAATILSHAPSRGRRAAPTSTAATPSARQRRDHLRDAIRRPPLRVAVGGARREADDALRRADSPAPASSASALCARRGRGLDPGQSRPPAGASMPSRARARGSTRPGARAGAGGATPRVSSQPRPAAR